MRTAIVALVTAVAFLTSVAAGPRKVLVLPLDGDAPPDQKSQLDDSVQAMARAKLAGDVTIGDTTFAETATAVGCDPKVPACAETVRSTLSVDELVYGSATVRDGNTTVTVYRITKDAPPATQTTVIAATEPGAQAEPALEPVFTEGSSTSSSGSTDTGSDGLGSAAPGPGSDLAAGSDVASGSDATTPAPRSNFFDTRERKLGVGLAGGGVIALVIGFSLWASKSDLQDQIDDHPTRTYSDFQDLTALEDRAGSRALWGNLMVGLGLALGGAGAYYLYKDHKNRSATLTPAPVESGSGMTLVFAGRW